MRQISLALVALALCADLRAGVRRPGVAFDAKQSAALFVGVRDFDDRTIAPVPYAVDDAVDLAYELVIDHQPKLVTPQRVVLALSKGLPVKAESRRKLRALLAAGATLQPAEHTAIARLLQTQSKGVGREGMLIVFFATHGVSDTAARQHLLTAGSRLEGLAATITDVEIEETASRNDVPRSLVIIDACRERLTRGRGGADPRSAARNVIGKIEGQVVFTAAAQGGYAYDDDQRRNGVFTESVIDGLRCNAAKDWHGFVTVDTLGRYVSRTVLKWIRKNRDRNAKGATRLIREGESGKLPLSICVNRNASASASPTP